MGKASKWIINFLLGRKESKEKKKDGGASSVEEIEETSTGIWPSTPLVKRRWSFGKSSSSSSSSSKQKSHKGSKSLDLMNTNPVVKKTILGLQTQQNHNDNTTLALIVAKPATVRTVEAPKPARYRISKEVADAAATKIQAVFRSYLARKALCALRGLVKVQALVRGHLVRKQTAATLRQMHALMAIQVRARFQRLQMAEESQFVLKNQSSSYRNFPVENEFRKAHREAIDTYLYDTHGVPKSKYDNLNHSRIGRIEQGVTEYFSGGLSFSRQEHHQHEEFSFSTAHSTPRCNRETCNSIPGRASFSCQQPDYAHQDSCDSSFQPNYMTNTQSSRAKARSQSEPKQRPKRYMRAENKQVTSFNGTTGMQANPQSRQSSPRSKRIKNEIEDPWFIAHYEKSRDLKAEDSDANNTITNCPNYCNSLLDYGPHVNLY